MNEHTFSSKILTKCRNAGIVKAWKINDDYQGGVPDSWMLGIYNDLWVEFKFLKAIPKRDGTVIVPKLSPQQLEWLMTLQSHNKKALCVIGLPKQAIILADHGQWTTGITVRDARRMAMTHNELVDILTTICGV